MCGEPETAHHSAYYTNMDIGKQYRHQNKSDGDTWTKTQLLRAGEPAQLQFSMEKPCCLWTVTVLLSCSENQYWIYSSQNFGYFFSKCVDFLTWNIATSWDFTKFWSLCCITPSSSSKFVIIPAVVTCHSKTIIFLSLRVGVNESSFIISHTKMVKQHVVLGKLCCSNTKPERIIATLPSLFLSNKWVYLYSNRECSFGCFRWSHQANCEKILRDSRNCALFGPVLQDCFLPLTIRRQYICMLCYGKFWMHSLFFELFCSKHMLFSDKGHEIPQLKRQNILVSCQVTNMKYVDTPDMLASSISHHSLLQLLHLRPDSVVDFVPLYSMPEFVVIHSKAARKQAPAVDFFLFWGGGGVGKF